MPTGIGRREEDVETRESGSPWAAIIDGGSYNTGMSLQIAPAARGI
jgi:hypothetical protein